ncbi:MAG: hypothetical protein U0528_21115 [Anaerolineae bacterium]
MLHHGGGDAPTLKNGVINLCASIYPAADQPIILNSAQAVTSLTSDGLFAGTADR